MTKNYIKDKLKEVKGDHTLDQFDKLAQQIYKSLHKDDKNSNYDENKVKKTMARYCEIKIGKVIFNTNVNSELNYKELKNKLTKTSKKNPNLFDNISLNSDKSDSKQFTKVEKKVNIKSDTESESDMCYLYCVNQNYNFQKKLPPFGTDWVHDPVQLDDKICSIVKKRVNIFQELAKLKFPAQKSLEWHALRSQRVTASDGGCVLGDNDYEPPHKLLIKKVLQPPFEANANCYHGNKFEQIATMLYELRMNVRVREFGLIKHPMCSFLAASPDGIVSETKLDGKHLTKYVGTMVEIKCPTSRKINTTGPLYGGKDAICPIYYWDQVQLQLECCDLDFCDFWQCKILEYSSREEFIEDTDSKEPFRSKTSSFEKGCIIQVIPLDKRMDAQGLKLQLKEYVAEDIKKMRKDPKKYPKDVVDALENNPDSYEEVDNGEDPDVNNDKYLDIVYESSKHVYPPKIEMTPYECDEWLSEVIQNFHKQKLLDPALNTRNYYIDKIIYWKLDFSHCVKIERNREWFKDVEPKIGKMWSYVEYLRENKDKADILFPYIESVTEKMPDFQNPKKTKDVKMTIDTLNKVKQVIEDICLEPNKKDKTAVKKYLSRLEEIKQATVKNLGIKKTKDKNKKFY
jgi:putative phage-type endonuclease